MGDGVQISEKLLFQLIEGDEELKKKTRSRISKESQQKPIKNESETPKGTPPALQVPFFFPTPQLPTSSNPEFISIRSVLKESEAVLEKVQKREENIVNEVTERAKELHEKEFKLPQQKTLICQIEIDDCAACYKVHVKDPLKCSTMVASYQECVHRARKQVQVPSS